MGSLSGRNLALRRFDVDKQLHNRLEELHGELQQIKYVDEGEQQLLQDLMGDIKKLISEGEGNRAYASEQLGERLKEGIELFEASHPRTTMLMGQVIDALAKMGI
jgi:predicted component of type VI protein secretion system